MKKLSYLTFVGIMFFAACGQSKTIDPIAAEYEIVCILKDNISSIKEPLSFTIMPSGEFALADGDQVFLYSHDGEQVRRIGTRGKAMGEYNMPTNIKIHNDTVYVWSAMSLKFIAYTTSGELIAEYKYDSAIADFIPTDDVIYIYNSGRSSANIVDVYDKKQNQVIKSLTESSAEHRILLRSWVASPFFFKDGELYYMPRNELALYKYDYEEGKELLVDRFESTTFNIERETDHKAILTDRKKASKYLRENSCVIGIIPNANGKFSILTIEGQTKVVDDNYDTSGRIITFYDIDKRESVTRYYYDSIGTQVLFSCLNNELYFLKHSIENDDDVLKLCKLIVK